MKKLLKCFKIHPITFIYFLMALLAGYFKNYIIIFLIVIFHEICHLLMAYFFHFDIKSMTLFPFGAYLDIPYFGQYHVIKEILVVTVGPLSHIIIYAILLYIKPWIGPYSFHYALYFNKIMFLFNWLPIYPLDGYKLFLLLLSFVLPYKFTMQCASILSISLITVVIYLSLSPQTLLIFIFLIVLQISHIQRLNQRYVAFLLYRNHFCRYQKVKINPGYSLYRPYKNIYLKNRII